ncbi:hypothetical protein BH10BAC2_BH10BAC2_41740 [soil metagenome]
MYVFIRKSNDCLHVKAANLFDYDEWLPSNKCYNRLHIIISPLSKYSVASK